jgi:adenylosuccinate synthase
MKARARLSTCYVTGAHGHSPVGGANAGHTVVVRRNTFSPDPSGVLHQALRHWCRVVIDPGAIVEEIQHLHSRIDLRGRLFISPA